MDSYHLGIATATLHFSNLYWFRRHHHYAFDITFKNTSSLLLKNLELINAGMDNDEAQDFLNALKKYFEQAGIVDGSDVIVLFSGCQILAIGTRGKDLWIDVRKGVFIYTAPVNFASLRMEIKSLEVY